MNVIFKELIIIDKSTHMAKIQFFTEGINIITSDMEKGNYVGKSTLLKSLYHSLGADLDFDSSKGWEISSKYYYILTFSKDNDVFTVIRKDKSFLFYNEKKERIFATQNRDELAKFYCDFFKMNILLKEKNDFNYATSKPFALFCLSYVGQKHYDGCNFTSFNFMCEYSNSRDDIILSHLGVNDAKKNELEEKNKKYFIMKNNISINKDIVENLINKIDENKELNYSIESIEAVKIKLSLYEKEYKKLIDETQSLKKDMYKLKDTKVLILNYINEIKSKLNSQNKNEKILKSHKCPLCENEITNYNEVFFKKVYVDDSLPVQLIDSESELSEIDRQIELKLKHYKEKEQSLNKLEMVLTNESKSIENAVASFGLKKYKDALIGELGNACAEIDKLDKEIAYNKKEIAKLNKKIVEINKSYKAKLIYMKEKYNITIFDVPNNTTIRTKINCSDSHVLTTLWLCVLNQLKHEFNPNSTFFPLVFDNPTDRDFDQHNTESIIKMIFDEKEISSQIILSKLKFDKDKFSNYEINNYVNLINSQYHLLNKEDYNIAIEKLISLLN